MKELAELIYNLGIPSDYMGYIFKYKFGRLPNLQERSTFEMEYNKIVEEESSYEDESYSY